MRELLPQAPRATAFAIRNHPRAIHVWSTLLLVAFLIGASATSRAEDGPLWTQSDPQSTIIVNHMPWDQFLATYVVIGEDAISRVRYGAVTDNDHAALKNYIASLAGTDIPALNRDEQFALWVNLYNALTVNVILDAYPVDTIKDIKPNVLSFGPWKKDRVTVLGQNLSLDDIEHGILREYWDDPRVHYAVNCASIGCPNLRPEAYKGSRLNAQLDDAARAYVNHSRGAEIRDGKLYVSSIYDWFKEDFDDSDSGVIAHLKIYAKPDLVSALDAVKDIEGDVYDWSLNDITEQTIAEEG